MVGLILRSICNLLNILPCEHIIINYTLILSFKYFIYFQEQEREQACICTHGRWGVRKQLRSQADSAVIMEPMRAQSQD